jgi:lysophospholipase L1-like esterase
MRLKLTPMSMLLAFAAIVAFATVGIAEGGPAQRSLSQVPQSYYLALGDSIAYGIQPTRPAARPSEVAGYVGPLAARLRKLSPTIQVVNYGCPGESTVTFTKGGCPWLAEGRKLHSAFRGPQLEAALAFLRAHRGEVSPITLTLWGNDLAPLSAKGKRAPSAIASFASRFDSILKRLRGAAPTAEIVVTGAWNPEADQLKQTQPLYRSLDAAISRVAAASQAHVANMLKTFNGSGNARAQRARLCALTFSCKGDPHPTDAGYRAMANAFLVASGYPRNP